MFLYLAGLDLIDGFKQAGLIFQAEKWFVMAAYFKRYLFLAQYGPGKQVDSHGRVHSGIGAKGIEAFFISSSMRMLKVVWGI